MKKLLALLLAVVLFRQLCGLKSLKYIQYSCTFQNLDLTKKFSPNLLAELCGAA